MCLSYSFGCFSWFQFLIDSVNALVMDSIITVLSDFNQISLLCKVDRSKDLDPLKLLSVLL